jgi:hypothetical protein
MDSQLKRITTAKKIKINKIKKRPNGIVTPSPESILISRIMPVYVNLNKISREILSRTVKEMIKEKEKEKSRKKKPFQSI